MITEQQLWAKGYFLNKKGELEKIYKEEGLERTRVRRDEEGYWNLVKPEIPIIAIDPGSSGSIAISHTDGSVEAHALKDKRDLCKHLIPFRSKACKAYVELVTGFIARPKAQEGEFKMEQSGHLMFNFGKGAGYIEGALDMAGIPFELVFPKTWQKPLCMEKKGKSRTTWKNELKERMQKIFPDNKVTLATADALGILNYALLKKG